MRASGSRVLHLIDEGLTLTEIEVDSNWHKGEIVALARENSWGLNVSSDRFQRVAAPKPAPIGIVRQSPPIPTFRACGAQDNVTGRVCVKPHGHDDNHQDGAGNRAWPQTDTGAEADSGLPASGPSHEGGTNRGRGGEPSLSSVPVSPIARDLLAEGLASITPRVKRAAEKARTALDDLARVLAETREAEAAKVAAEAEKVKRAARIAELEEQLRAEKAALRGNHTQDTARATAAAAATHPRVPYSVVRAWADENCCGYGHKGRPPKDVMDAYLAAQDVAS